MTSSSIAIKEWTVKQQQYYDKINQCLKKGKPPSMSKTEWSKYEKWAEQEKKRLRQE